MAFQGCVGFTSGMVVGRSAMAAGFTIGVVDDVGARVDAQQPRPLAEKVAERLRQKEALGRKGLQKERR